MTPRKATAADFGLSAPPPSQALLEARAYLAALHWGQDPLPALSPAAAAQVRLLRQEAAEQREALRHKHQEQHERDRARDLTAQLERERRGA